MADTVESLFNFLFNIIAILLYIKLGINLAIEITPKKMNLRMPKPINKQPNEMNASIF